MSYHYAPLVPEGITKKECERGSLHFEAPIPYVPPKCKLTKEHGDHSITVKMGKDLEEQVPVFNGGIAEAHVAVVQQQNRLLSQAGLQKDWTGWNAEEQSAKDDLLFELALKPEKPIDENSQAFQEYKTKLRSWTDKNQSLQDKAKNAAKAKAALVTKSFHLCQMFLGEVPKTKWQAIVHDTCQHGGWADDRGTLHDEPRGLSFDTLRLCQRKWLGTVLKKDAAEKQRAYLQYYVFRPLRVSLRDHEARLSQLNHMLKLLPCLKDENPNNNEIEHMAKPFTGVEMANIILKGTPQKMQELYYMNNEFPTRTKPLIEKLEALEPIVKDFASRKKRSPG